jgi:hypothetical protein
MAREILGGYGPDANKPQRARASSGGITAARDVNRYQKPQGPTSIGNRKVGLGGDNYGPSGFQGQTTCPPVSSQGGGPGLGGSRRPKGAQR